MQPGPPLIRAVPPFVVRPAGIADVPCFLRDCGLVTQYLHRCQLAAAGHTTPPYPPAARRLIALIAQRLLVAATSRGWAALAALLQPALGEQPVVRPAAALHAAETAGGAVGGSPEPPSVASPSGSAQLGVPTPGKADSSEGAPSADAHALRPTLEVKSEPLRRE